MNKVIKLVKQNQKRSRSSSSQSSQENGSDSEGANNRTNEDGYERSCSGLERKESIKIINNNMKDDSFFRYQPQPPLNS
jgi:hypothetical protein